MDINKILIVVVIVAIVVGAGAYYLGYTKGYNVAKEEGIKVETTTPEVGIDEAVGGSLDDMPSSNPYEDVANPYDDAYKNPFE